MRACVCVATSQQGGLGLGRGSCAPSTCTCTRVLTLIGRYRVTCTYHDPTEIARFKLCHGKLDSLQHVGPDSLSQEGVEVDRASQELDVSLLEDGHIAVGRRVMELVGLAVGTEPLVQVNAAV